MLFDVVGLGKRKPSPNEADSQSQWQPIALREINPDFVDAINALYRRRPPRRVILGGRSLSVTFNPVWRRTLPAVPDAWTLTFDIGGDPAELICPRGLVDSIFASIEDSINRAALSRDIQALLLEYILGDALEKIESLLGASIFISAVHKGLATWIGYDYPVLAIEMEIEGAAKTWCTLRASHHHLLRLAQGLERLPAASAAPVLVDLPLPVNLRLASVDLSLAEVKSLQAGDIVLPDARPPEADIAMAVVSESLVAPVKMLPTGYQLVDLLKPATGSALSWCVDAPAERFGPLHDGSAQDIPIRVFVELGRFELPFSALKELSQGAQIGADALPGVWFDLVAGGAVIGHCEATVIGEDFGFRIVRT